MIALKLALISSLVTFFTFILNKKFSKEEVNWKKLRLSLRKLMEDFNDKNLEEFLEYNRRILSSFFSPIYLLSFLIAALVFVWVNIRYGKLTVFILPITLPLIGNRISGLVFYILISIILNFLVSKLFQYYEKKSKS